MPSAIGAVVDGVPTTSQIPLSGHFEPVRAVVPKGERLTSRLQKNKERDMAKFGLVKSFDIDDGQLDDLRVQDCFVLGYELAMVDQLVEGDDEISQLIHANNRERVAKSCRDADRQFRIAWMDEDPSEDWLMLYVDAR